MYFSGSNLFGQWYGCSDKIIEVFKYVPDTTLEEQMVNSNFNVRSAELVHIGWSHNIFKFRNKYYITGDYNGSGKYLNVVSLPDACKNASNLVVVSDDYYLVIINKETGEIWSVNLENKDVRTISLSTEVPVASPSKRIKTNHILKCVAANGMLMFINSGLAVYSGLMPNLIDTAQCIGKPMDVQCGYEHCMLLTDIGRVYTWGNGRRLQLGHGDVSILEVPMEIEALAGIKIVKIAAGGWHSLALSEFGDLYAWGWNDTGQLGIKENSNTESLKSYPIPTLVDLFEDDIVVNLNVLDIACGSRHSCILLEDHTVWTTGNNKYGQLGFPKNNNPAINYFKKSCSFECVCRLMCGQWSSVVITNK